MGFVKLEQQGHVGILTIDRQEALNALNSQVLSDLDAALDQVEANEEIYVVILTGAGRSFVAGADIGEMKQFSSIDGRNFGIHGGNVFLKLENLSKPVIAAVNGFALGGGCEISMACDIRVAAENAKFAQPECGLGILPGFGGTQRLARLVGKGRAKEMIFTCDMIDAQDAYRIGLANHVVPQEELLDYCKAMAGRIMKNAPYAVSLAKQVINSGADMDLDNGLKLEANIFGLSFSTEDKKEGMTAFLEKRKEKHFIGK